MKVRAENTPEELSDHKIGHKKDLRFDVLLGFYSTQRLFLTIVENLIQMSEAEHDFKISSSSKKEISPAVPEFTVKRSIFKMQRTYLCAGQEVSI